MRPRDQVPPSLKRCAFLRAGAQGAKGGAPAFATGGPAGREGPSPSGPRPGAHTHAAASLTQLPSYAGGTWSPSEHVLNFQETSHDLTFDTNSNLPCRCFMKTPPSPGSGPELSARTLTGPLRWLLHQGQSLGSELNCLGSRRLAYLCRYELGDFGQVTVRL